MPDIDDDGKIWLRGSARPEYGVRVGLLYFVPGKKDSENSTCFIHEKCLVADLHDPENQYRIIRRFSLALEPYSSGTLFNGFKKTKHADINAVTYLDKKVEEFLLDGNEYLLNSDRVISAIQIMQLTGWK